MWVELAQKVADENPSYRDDGHPAVSPNSGVGADLAVALAAAIPARQGERCQAVAGLVSASDRFARRLPFVRGRPFVPGKRGEPRAGRGQDVGEGVVLDEVEAVAPGRLQHAIGYPGRQRATGRVVRE